MRLTGFPAIEFAEKQNLLLNKHPSTTEGPRNGLTVPEAEASASEDEGLIYLDVRDEDYSQAAPSSFVPER
jgi:hypothetical protein